MPSTGRHLPRLRKDFYRGFAAVHWTFCLKDRATGWLDERFHARFREVLVHANVRYHCLCAAYCLMPDHWHLLLVGVRSDSDQFLAASFLRKHLEPALQAGAFQKQSFDHVLRKEETRPEAFVKVCHYILENPVRAGLVERADEYAFSGSVISGYPDLRIHQEEYWDLFWRIHDRLTNERRSP